MNLFRELDDNSKKELLSHAEFKQQAYEDDPNLKDAEEAAAEYIRECEEMERKVKK